MNVKPFVDTPVPDGVVTDTSTVPETCAGVRHVIVVASTTITPVALDVPNLTDVVPVNEAPVIVTLSPPSVKPEFGEILVTVGGTSGV